MADKPREEGSAGIVCPYCLHNASTVKDTRPREEGRSLRRRRLCLGCGARFTTHERVYLRELVVVKRAGWREMFDGNKLRRSVLVAVAKRPIDPRALDHVIDRTIRNLQDMGDTEIESATIGRIVLNALRSLDAVAYVRYASVYQDFQTAGDFAEFLEHNQP